MCKIEKSGRGRPGRGVVLEIRTHPDKGRGWFENPRFWLTSFVDCRRPLILSSLKLNVVISLGEYINAVVSRIVIGTLDLKQFLPKFKYFC